MKTKLITPSTYSVSGKLCNEINQNGLAVLYLVFKGSSMKRYILACLLFTTLLFPKTGLSDNPIIKNKFTADPCALVHGNTVYLYTGHDEASTTAPDYVMNNWHVFSSQDMVNWTDHGQKLAVSNFSWARSSAFAGHTVHRNGKFYWYVPMIQRSGGFFSIGVAVADSPLGPFTDALGKPLISDEMTTDLLFDIDPAVFIDDDGQAYIYWGNATEGGPCKMAKLKSNMTEIDGAITTVSLPNWTEAPYVHKRNGTYYLSYASGWPETISYATGTSPSGPWTHRGILNDRVNSSTNHQSIIEFKGRSYFVYHNAGLPTGTDYRRSVCIDYLNYNTDGTMQRIVQTTQGVAAVNATPEITPWQSTERITGAHDPTIIRDDRGVYTLLTTNNLLQLRQSTDMVNWTSAGRIFNSLPSWLNAVNSGIVDIWAPQIVFRNGRYWVYYSGSSFGSNNSAIGVASSPTLNTNAANYGWTDHGEVFRSASNNNYNAIDPELLTDNTGKLWLSFGSFWSGIKMIAIDPATGKRLASNNTVYSLASRGGGAIEGPSTIEHNGYYFLFTSWDNCCAGLNSTYRTMVGRSTSPNSGFVDKQNRSVMNNYSEEVLRSYGRYIGPGGGAPFKDGRRDYYVHHYYNGNQNGSPTLQIREIVWDDSNWPVIAQPFLGRRLSYEAEHSILTNSTISAGNNASNREYVSNISTAASKALFYINAFAAGEYTLRIHYSASSNASHFLKVNNGISTEILYPSTGNSGQFPVGQAISVKVILKEGGNTLEFTKGANTSDLDRIDLIRNTFAKLEGGAKDNGVGETYVSTGNNSSLVANSWLMFENFDFANGGLKNLKVALAGASTAQFRISIDAQNGSINETFTTSSTLNTFALSTSLQSITGIHDVYVTLLNGSCQLDYLQFDNNSSENPPVNQAPTISITLPTNNAVFIAPALININAIAADADGTVTKVDFYNGTTLLGTDLTSPFSYAWANAPAGTYSITARVTDNGGATTTSVPITVVVNQPLSGFTLQAENFCTADGLSESNNAGFNGAGFLNLSNTAGTSGSWALNSSVSQTVNLAIRYANGSANNRNMSLSVNGIIQLANIDLQPTGSWTTWNSVTIPLTLTSNYNTVSLTSLMDEGAPNLDEFIFSVATVSAANCIPAVSLTVPAANIVTCQGTAVTLTATANDPDGTISKVEFYNGATLLGMATTSPYTFIWNNAGVGSHTLTAKATDNGNSTTTSVAINITVNAVPSTPTGTSPVSYCQDAAASVLAATGTSLQWYTAATGGAGSATAPRPSTTTAGTTNYYVSQTINTCESSRALIAVTVNANPSAPIGTSPVSYCQDAAASVLAATGTSLQWYTAATGGTGSATAPRPSTTTAGITNYYVSQTINTCESSRALIAVTVHVNPSAPTAISPVSYCQDASASVLAATGTLLQWYTAATGGTGSATAPRPSTTTAGITNYYVSQTINTCESSRALIAVTVLANPLSPAVTTPVNYCQDEVSSTLSATGASLKWYTSATGGTGSASALRPSTTAAGTTNYYVSQTINTCESSRALIAVTVLAKPAASINANGPTTFIQGGSVVLSANTGQGFTYRWLNGTVPVGINSAYTASIGGDYTVEVTNSSGCKTTSGPLSVTVNANQLPTVIITSPVNHATISGTSVTINVTATDPDGSITKVDYYNGTTFIGTSTSEPFSFTWNNPPSGTHVITVKATDSNGGITTSTGTTITTGSATGISLVKEVFNRVYPNPSSGQILIETDINLGNVSLSLVNESGAEVSIDIYVMGSNAMMDVSSLAAGIYTLLIKGDGFISRKKIMVGR